MTIPALLRGLFDDAALFPPGNAPMPDAVTGHLGYRESWYAGLVGPFVCPDGRLTELDAELARQRRSPLAVSMTVPGGPVGLRAAVQRARSLGGVELVAVELPVAAEQLADLVDPLCQTADAGLQVFAEVPVGEVDSAVAGTLAEAGIGLKLRTGGSTADAFPGIAGLAAAIRAAATAGVRVKCTAGLHQALPHTDPATGFRQHGFLNVLLAMHAAQAGADPAEPLACHDPDVLAGRARQLSGPAVANLRGQFRSIGSCSIAEPLTDLIRLGLVSAP